MKTKTILTALLLTLALLVTSCGTAEAETEGTDTVDTAVEETAAETETTPETEAETKKEVNYTNFKKLTVTEETAYENGYLMIRFTDSKVRYLAEDTCAIGISADGEAYSIAGSVDMEASAVFQEGDFYSGIAVKPSEALAAGEYKFIVTVANYMMIFNLAID